MTTPKAVRLEFSRETHPNGLLVPQGIRVFHIAGVAVRVPGSTKDSTVVFVHPDDVEKLKEANP